MLKNTTINLGVIREIAHALKDLNERVVYVGGAVSISKSTVIRKVGLRKTLNFQEKIY